MHARATRLTMISHGPIEHSKLRQETPHYGDKNIKITTSWLAMLKLSIKAGDNLLPSQ